MTENSFDARAGLDVGGKTHTYYRLEALQPKYDVARLPYSLKVLLENLLRNEDGETVTADHIEALATWDAKADPSKEIPYTPPRVARRGGLLQGDPLHARARGPAGLRRRALRRRPRRDARRDRRTRWRPRC